MPLTLIVAAAILIGSPGAVDPATNAPSAEITNGLVHAKIYLPDSKRGFYRGTRFDWSGVIYNLQANGHDYYGPWFDKTDPSVRDFLYREADIVAGPCSAITGPVDEFGPLGYSEAKAGGTFVKIGVGALKKADDNEYDNYRLYEIVDGGKWDIRKGPDELAFTQRVNDAGSGYSYVYEKELRLTSGKNEMLLIHRLQNTGKRPIVTTVYNHNFLVLDGRPPGPGVTITVPFQIKTPEPLEDHLATIQGSQIAYIKKLQGRDKVATRVEGFNHDPTDNQVRIENSELGAGISWQSDVPLLREALWSIRSVIAMEPFVSISIEPGDQFSWRTTYEYYKLPPAAK